MVVLRPLWSIASARKPGELPVVLGAFWGFSHGGVNPQSPVDHRAARPLSMMS
jgi:hypothetical protein